MDIKVIVKTKRKCAASIDWDRGFTKATLSFGDKETPETDVEVMFTIEQLAELGKVACDAELAGKEGRSRIKAQRSNEPYHGGSC